MKFSSVFRFSFTFIFTHNLIVFSKCKSLNESTKRKTIFNIYIVEDYMIMNMQVILPVEDEDKARLNHISINDINRDNDNNYSID